MKWKKFIEQAKKAGVKDDDEIWFIDIAFDDELALTKHPTLGWSIS
jgi:hypothetical protein